MEAVRFLEWCWKEIRIPLQAQITFCCISAVISLLYFSVEFGTMAAVLCFIFWVFVGLFILFRQLWKRYVKARNWERDKIMRELNGARK